MLSEGRWIKDSVRDLDTKLFTENIAIVAPHMDDEVLACGGLIAKLPDKYRIHVIYATDGLKSPSPIISRRDEISKDLGKVRMGESREAMKLMGVPEQNLHFFSLPETRLHKPHSRLGELLRDTFKKIEPKHVFVPFRYDRHIDHLAVNHAVVAALEAGTFQAQLIEYFVYYRWRLLPKGDVRKYIKPQFLYKLDISDVARQKRQSLDCFTSQATIYYPWQTRPVLMPKLLDEECQNPEFYLVPHGLNFGTAIFSDSVLWILLVHRLEPFLQRWKYLIGAVLKRMSQAHGY